MTETAEKIRKALKENGYNNRMVSVKCLPSYQIEVGTKKLDNSGILKVSEIAQNIYYQGNHHWLILWVNDYCIPMNSQI